MSDGNPVVYYQQKKENTCLFNAVSSVLMYNGDRDAAELVNCLISDGQKQAHHLHYINMKLVSEYDIFHVVCNYEEEKDKYTFTLKKETSSYYSTEIVQMAKTYISSYPKVGIIEASDGCLNHAVGVCKDWIFDTTLPHAIKLNKDNLDWCASTDAVRSHFVKFDECVMYVKKANKKKKWVRVRKPTV